MEIILFFLYLLTSFSQCIMDQPIKRRVDKGYAYAIIIIGIFQLVVLLLLVATPIVYIISYDRYGPPTLIPRISHLSLIENFQVETTVENVENSVIFTESGATGSTHDTEELTTN